MASLSRLDVDMTNLHAAGTIDMRKAALEGLTRPGWNAPHAAGGDAAHLHQRGADAPRALIDKPLAEVASSTRRTRCAPGLDGVVCSPLEAGAVHERCGASFLTVTPGVRFAGGDHGDQVRVTTPERAAELGLRLHRRGPAHHRRGGPRRGVAALRQ